MAIVRSLKTFFSSLSVLSPPIAFDDGSKESSIKLLTYPDYPFRSTNQKVTEETVAGAAFVRFGMKFKTRLAAFSRAFVPQRWLKDIL